MNDELKAYFKTRAVYECHGSQNRQDLINKIVRCLKGEGAWPDSKEIFYGEATKWENLSQNSPQTSGEISIISQNRHILYTALEHNDWIVELGVGTGINTKGERILRMAKKARCYIGVDRNRRFVYNHIARLSKQFPKVICVGLVGEFDNAYDILFDISQHSSFQNGCLLSLGSTLSNNSPEKLIQILRRWSRILPNMIIGQDSNTDAMSVGNAYRDSDFMQFIWAGLEEANKLLEKTMFVKEKFQVKVHIRPGSPFKVEAAITAPDGRTEYFEDGREVAIFTAYKYQEEDFIALVREANKDAFTKVLKAKDTGSRFYSISFPTQYKTDLAKRKRKAYLLGL